jgi:hypothetical protein
MLDYTIDNEHHLVTVTPSSELSVEDFKRLSAAIDSYNTDQGPLRSLLIITEHFPGWDNFAAMLKHFQFAHREAGILKKVAVVTDSGFLSIMPGMVDHFVQTEIRHFAYQDQKQALPWLQQG